MATGDIKVKARRKSEIARAKEQLSIAVNDAASTANSSLIKIVYAALAFMSLSLVFNIYFIVKEPPQPIILTSDKNGAITAISSFNQPPASTQTLVLLAQRYAMALLDMNSLNAYEVIEQNREYFLSDQHFEAYKENLINSEWFKAMISNKMAIRISPDDITMMNSAGIYSQSLGMTEWRVSVPVRIRIEAPGYNPQTLERVMLLQLVHARSSKYHHGIAIAGMQIRRRNDS